MNREDKKYEKYFKNQKPPNDRNTGNYIDPYFPPEDTSLIAENCYHHLDQVKIDINISRIEWKRPKEIFGEKNFHLFENKIELNDIKQGSLSNCYLLSSIASLTEFPELIYQIFINKEVEDFGYYELVLFIDGEWQIIFVDDYIPCYKGTNQTYFAKPSGTELWVIFLEKAWAKVNGGYSNTVLGEVIDPLRALTGYFIESTEIPLSVNLRDITKIWEKIKIADEKDFILCAGTKNENSVENCGLLKGHAYSLISARQKSYDEKLVRLVKMYNPWGHKEWTGPWSDNSPLWDEELITYFGKLSKDDGTFFMEIDDFVRYFTSIYVCHMMYGANLSSFKFEENVSMKPFIFNFELQQDDQIAFSVIFKHWRYNRDIINYGKNITKFSLIIVKYNDKNEFEEIYASQSFQNQDIEYVQNDMKKGKYYIWLSTLYTNIVSFSYVFRIASFQTHTVELLGEDKKYLLLQHILISNYKKKILSLKKEDSLKIELNDVSLRSAGLIAFIAINFSRYHHILSFTQTDVGNQFREIYCPKRLEDGKVKVCLGPSDAMCIVQSIMENGTNLKIAFTKNLTKDESPNTEYKPEKLGEYFRLIQIDRPKIKSDNDKFPFVEELKFSRDFDREEIKKVFYSFRDIMEYNRIVCKELKSLIPNIQEDEERFIIKKEYDGLYIGQPQQGDYIGAKIYEDLVGKIYVGYWRNRKWNGNGIIYNQKSNIVTYQGEFEGGEMHGKGNLIMENNDIYTGYFENSKLEGIGQYYSPKTDNIFVGYFKQGKKDGKGLEINKYKIMVMLYTEGNYIDSKEIEFTEKIKNDLSFLMRLVNISKIDKLESFLKPIIDQSDFEIVYGFNIFEIMREYKNKETELMNAMDKIIQKNQFSCDMLSNLLTSPLRQKDIKMTETEFGYILSLNAQNTDVQRYMCYLNELECYMLQTIYKEQECTAIFSKDFDIIFEGRLYDGSFMNKYYGRRGESLEYSPGYPEIIYSYPRGGQWRGRLDFKSFQLVGQGIFHHPESNIIQPLTFKDGSIILGDRINSYLDENSQFIKTIDQFSNNKFIDAEIISSAMQEIPYFHLFKPQELFYKSNYPKNKYSHTDITCKGPIINIPNILYREYSETGILFKTADKLSICSNFFGKDFDDQSQIKYLGTYDNHLNRAGIGAFYNYSMTKVVETRNQNNDELKEGISQIVTTLKDTNEVTISDYYFKNQISIYISPYEEENEKKEQIENTFKQFYCVKLQNLSYIDIIELLGPKNYSNYKLSIKHMYDGLYYGKVNSDSQACGQGIIHFNNSNYYNYYIGYWHNDLKHGDGILINTEKEEYQYVIYNYGREIITENTSNKCFNDLITKLVGSYNESKFDENKLTFSSEYLNTNNCKEIQKNFNFVIKIRQYFLSHIKNYDMFDCALSNLNCNKKSIIRSFTTPYKINSVGQNDDLSNNCDQVSDSIRVICPMIYENRMAIISGSNKKIRIFDFITGRCLLSLGGHNGYVNSVITMIYNDRTVIVSGSEDTTIKIWDITTGQCLFTLEGHIKSVNTINTMINDGRTLIISGSEDTTIKIWDISTGQCLKTLEGHSDSVNSVETMIYEGRTIIVSGSDDSSIKIWDTNTGQCVSTLEEHSKSVKSITIMIYEGEPIIVSGSEDTTIKIWDLNINQSIATLEDEHTKSVNSVTTMTYEGQTVIVSGSEDTTIKIWDTTTGQCLNTLEGHSNSVNSVTTMVFEGISFIISGGEDSTIKIMDPDKFHTFLTLKGHSKSVIFVKTMIYEGRTVILSGSEDSSIKIWDPASGKCLLTFKPHSKPIKCVELMECDGKSLILSGSADTTIKITDPIDGQCLLTLMGHTFSVVSVTTMVYESKTVIVSGSNDKTIKLWDQNSRECLSTLVGHEHYVNSVTTMLFEGIRVIVSGSEDKTIKIWNSNTCQCLLTLKGHSKPVKSIATLIHEHNTLIISGSVDATIKIWDPHTGQCLSNLGGHTSSVTSVRTMINEDRTLILSGSEDMTNKLWDPITGQCILTIEGHNHYVKSVTNMIYEGRTFIISGTENAEIKIWKF